MSTETTRVSESTRTPRTHDLTTLAQQGGAELGRLYAAGRVAPTLAALDGHPRGRMLAIRHLESGPLGRALRAFSGAGAFPWGGKSFHALGTAEGEGINRVHLGGRHQLFPFRTRIDASVVDGAPAVILDYDRADNPGFIRAIHDEVRLVDDGLWLGPAMWKTAAKPVHVLWFALDTHVQAAPIGSAAHRA
jgi:hypothetical protein